MKKAVIYIRSRSENSTFPVEMQLQVCRGYAHARGAEIVRIYKDISERTNWQLLMQESISLQYDYVIAYDCARVSRKTDEMISFYSTLKRNGKRLLFATGGQPDWDTIEKLQIILNNKEDNE